MAAVWLVEEDVYQVLLFRDPFCSPSKGDGTRDARGAFAESLKGNSNKRKHTVVRSIRQVSTRFGEGREQLDRRRARGVLSSCARESKARTGIISR